MVLITFTSEPPPGSPPPDHSLHPCQALSCPSAAFLPSVSSFYRSAANRLETLALSDQSSAWLGPLERPETLHRSFPLTRCGKRPPQHPRSVPRAPVIVPNCSHRGGGLPEDPTAEPELHDSLLHLPNPARQQVEDDAKHQR